LTAIIEKLSGRPLEEVLRSRLFDPCGLPSMALRRFDADPAAEQCGVSSH